MNNNAEDLFVLEDPYFILQDSNDLAVLGVTLLSLLSHPLSIFNMPIDIANMLLKDLYDISDPRNFIHFGSYTSRLETFRQKYEYLYDLFNLTRADVKNKSIQQHLLSFDKFLRYLLYLSEALSFDVDGKTIYSIVSYSNPNFLDWYKRKYKLALDFDLNNIHRLLTLVPLAVLLDLRNKDFKTLVLLLGNTMDLYWAAIKAIPKLTIKLLHLLLSYSILFLKEVLINYGIDFNINYSNKTITLYFGEHYLIDTKLINPLTYNRRLLARLVSNAPFLIKGKGTKGALQLLLRIYGLSLELISIIELDNRNLHDYGRNEGNSKSQVVTRPYYHTTTNNLIVLKIGDCNTIILYCRIPYGKDSTLSIIDSLLDNNNYLVGKQYMFYLYDTQRYDAYCEGLSIVTDGTLNNNIPTVILIKNSLYVDSIKLASYDYNHSDRYALGSNVIYLLENVKAIYDFNRVNYIVKEGDTTITVEPSGFQYGQFEIYTKQSIFPLFIDTNKNYLVYTSEEDNMQVLETGIDVLTVSGSKPKLSTIIIGTNTSQRFNSLYILDNLYRIQDLLDTTLYLTPYKKWSLNKYYLLLRYRDLYYRELAPKQEDVSTYLEQVEFYLNLDGGLFKLMKLFIPATVTPHIGLVIGNNILTRNKIPTQKTPLLCLKVISPSYLIRYKHPMSVTIDNFKTLKAIPTLRFNPVKSIDGFCKKPRRPRLNVISEFKADYRKYKAYGSVLKLDGIKLKKMIVTDKGLRITNTSRNTKKEN